MLVLSYGNLESNICNPHLRSHIDFPLDQTVFYTGHSCTSYKTTYSCGRTEGLPLINAHLCVIFTKKETYKTRNCRGNPPPAPRIIFCKIAYN